MTNNRECQSLRSRFGRMMHSHGLPILWSAITAAAALGAVGYARYLHAEGTALDPLRIIYLTLQLFTLESNLDSMARVPLELTLARILCPALLAFAAWKAFASLFADEMRRLKMPFMKHHVIICGLGERGLHLTRSLRGCSSQRRAVIIIENDMENDHIPGCKKMGAIVVEGNADDAAVLREARIEHADAVFALTSDDGTNLGTALLAKKIVGQTDRTRTNPLRCRAAIGDLLFAELGHDRNRICSDASFEFEVLRFNEISARQLFEHHPLDGFGIMSQSQVRPHLVIAGFCKHSPD